jgi:TetR/AcrR family acrAB operon transcriptional repressor
VIERLHENALAAEIAAATAAEKAGVRLAEILIAEITARLKQLIAPLEGSPHVEELFSEHLLQARDIYQKYAAHYAEQLAATIERVCRRQHLVLKDMTAPDFARCIEMAFNGTKSAYPAMQPADAFLRDFSIMVRTLVAGAVGPSPKPRPARAAAKKSVRRKSGDRK